MFWYDRPGRRLVHLCSSMEIFSLNRSNSLVERQSRLEVFGGRIQSRSREFGSESFLNFLIPVVKGALSDTDNRSRLLVLHSPDKVRLEQSEPSLPFSSSQTMSTDPLKIRNVFACPSAFRPPLIAAGRHVKINRFHGACRIAKPVPESFVPAVAHFEDLFRFHCRLP